MPVERGSNALLLATRCPECGQAQGFHHVVPRCHWRFGPIRCEQCGHLGRPSQGQLLVDEAAARPGPLAIRIEFTDEVVLYPDTVAADA